MKFSIDMARWVISPEYLEQSKMKASMAQIERLGLRYGYEERAAILEYDGGLSREEAERQALLEIKNRMRGTA
jgi:hypothetical protein